MRRAGEQGSALIAVLALLFTAGIITTLMIAVANTGTFEVASHVEQQRSMYVAEGVAQRVQWLISIDRYLHSSETLGETDYGEYDYDRYLADGVRHTVDYYGQEVAFTIGDAGQGSVMSGTDYVSNLNRMKVGHEDDTDYTERLDLLRPKIADYIDTNDDISTDGMEAGDYEELDMKPLPRNGDLQFREELLYIPGFREFFPTDRNGLLTSVRLIPPENTVSLTGNPALLTATPAELQSYCNLEDEELEQVLAALADWKNERVKLSDSSLDPLILARLNNLSRQESGVYTVRIEAPETAKRPFRRLIFSFQAAGISGPSNKTIQYLQWMFF